MEPQSPSTPLQRWAQASRPSSANLQTPPPPTGPKSVARLLVSLGGLRLRNDVNHRGRQKLSPAWGRLQGALGAQLLASSALFSGVKDARDHFREGVEQQQRQAALRAEGLDGSRKCVLKMNEAHGARYIDQGNEEMYTQENLDKRYAIRHDPTVAGLLRVWWRACMGLNKQHKQPYGKLFAPEYCAVFEKVYKVMMPARDYDAAEAKRAVRDDWKSDAKGKRSMDEHAFMDALFELADVWTQTTDASEYAAFLEQLLLRVTAKSGEFLEVYAIKAGSMQPSDWDTALISSHNQMTHRSAKNLLAERGYIDGHDPNRRPARPPPRTGRGGRGGADGGEWSYDDEGRRRRAMHDGAWRAGGGRQDERYEWMAEGEDERTRGESEGVWRAGKAADTGRHGGGHGSFEPSVSSGGLFRGNGGGKRTKEKLAFGVGMKRGDIPYTGASSAPAEAGQHKFYDVYDRDAWGGGGGRGRLGFGVGKAHTTFDGRGGEGVDAFYDLSDRQRGGAGTGGANLAWSRGWAGGSSRWDEFGGCTYSGSGIGGGMGGSDGNSAYDDALRAMRRAEEEAKLRQRSAVALQSAARRRKAAKRRGRLAQLYLPSDADAGGNGGKEELIAALPSRARLFGLSERLQGLGGIKHVYYDATQPREHNAATRAQPGHSSRHVAYRRAMDAGSVGGACGLGSKSRSAASLLSAASAEVSPSPWSPSPSRSPTRVVRPQSAAATATATPASVQRASAAITTPPPLPSRRGADSPWAGAPLLVQLSQPAPARTPPGKDAKQPPKPAPYRPLSGSAAAALPHQMLARTPTAMRAGGVAQATNAGAVLRRAKTAPLGAAAGGVGWRVLALPS